MARSSRRWSFYAPIFGAIFSAPAALQAGQLPTGPLTDPAGDFRTFTPGDPNSYAGPDTPALDVKSVAVYYDSGQQTLTIIAEEAGPISDLVKNGQNVGSFSWGINHGYGNLNFSSIGLPNVLFDSVLSLSPNGTGTYRGTATPPGSVTVSGNTLTAVLPVSFLAPPPAPATGATGSLLPVEDWSYNLWPRSTVADQSLGGGPIANNAQIAEFAPDANDFLAQVVPEPSSVVMIGTGILSATVFGLRRSRRRKDLSVL
jgi:hypothetical protein